MPFTSFPILADLGTVGFSREASYAGIYRVEFGAGYGASAGLADRVMTFKLTWSKMCRDVDLITNEDGDLVDRVTYLFDFFCRRMENINEPFIIEDVCEKINLTLFNATGQTGRTQYLVQFVETKFSQQQAEMAYRFGYGLTVKQYRQAGLAFGEILAPNPQVI